MKLFRRRTPSELDAISVSVGELKRRLDTGEATAVVDVRQPYSYQQYPDSIPGSIRIPPAELPERYAELPRDRTVVLYCT